MSIVTGVIWRKEREKERKKSPKLGAYIKKAPPNASSSDPKDRKREASERGAMIVARKRRQSSLGMAAPPVAKHV